MHWKPKINIIVEFTSIAKRQIIKNQKKRNNFFYEQSSYA